MTELCFVDTNVLVYARDASESEKQVRAQEVMRALWSRRNGRTSFQVLQEYYVTVTRKLSPGLEASVARSDVRALQAWGPCQVDGRLLELAWTNTDRFGLSFWDALIVAASQRQECGLLLTEDLQDGMVMDAISVRNPFTAEFSLER